MTKLYAPKEYWELTRDEMEDMVNGCGPAGWKGDIILDHLLGVSIEDACNIHDYMYITGKDEIDREEADRTFLNNMLRIIEASSSNFMTRFIRRKLALHYYSAVRDYGSKYFWNAKNPPETFKNPSEIFA